MRKIIFMVVAIMLTFGLFAQEKNVVDEEAAKEIDKLKTALEEAGIDFNDCNFIPETIGDVEDDMSVDEFIESLDSGIKDSRSTYISGYALIPIYVLQWTPGGYIYVWNGHVASSPSISGSDWDGVRHTKETTYGSICTTEDTINPAYAYQWSSVSRTCPVLCAQLFLHDYIYIPGYGWIMIPVTFGDKECLTVNFNW